MEITKDNYVVLASKFLKDIEEEDKNKPVYLTKNHVYYLHQSLNEFYAWLHKNYWLEK